MVRLPVLWREPFSLASRMERLMDELFRDFGTFTDLELFPSFGRSDVYLKDKKLVIETEPPGRRRTTSRSRSRGTAS